METTGAGRIVVGVANTLAGYQALRFAVEQARGTGRPLVVVRTFPHSRKESWEWRMVMARQARAGVIEAFVEAFGAIPADLTITVIVEPGPAGAALARAADQPDDLIVVGGSSRRRGWRPKAVVAQACARLAVCPITVVPEPVMTRAGSVDHLARSVAGDADRFLRTRVTTG